MARFYFHLHDDMEVLDEEGSELPDAAAAHAVGVGLARFEVSQHARKGRVVLSHCIAIKDECGRPIETIYFRDVVAFVD